MLFYLKLGRLLLVDHGGEPFELSPHSDGVAVGLDEADVGLHGGALVADPVPRPVLVRVQRALESESFLLNHISPKNQIPNPTDLGEALDVARDHVPLLVVGRVLPRLLEAVADESHEGGVVAGGDVEGGALKLLNIQSIIS